jgi:hypothetical protein
LSSQTIMSQVSSRTVFEKEARTVMGRICQAVQRVVAESRAGERATDLIQSLRLDKTLAWHVMELAHAPVPILVAEHVPGEEGVRIVIDAVRRCGASPESCDELRDAAAAFRKLLHDHAGDRRTLEAMLATLAGPSSTGARAQSAARKQAFRANSAVFGVQARTQFEINLTLPSKSGKPEHLDFVSMRGWLGLSRLQPDAALVVSRARLHDPERAAGDRSEPLAQPLDTATAAQTGAPIVSEFSSRPLPLFRKSAADKHGLSTHCVSEGAIGRAGALDLTLGEVLRDVPGMYQRTPGERGEIFARCYTPGEHLLVDWLIHRDLWEGAWSAIHPELVVISEMCSTLPHPESEESKTRLETGAVLQRLTPRELEGTLRESPRHASMLRYAAEQAGASLDAFRAIRLRLSYPPVPSTVAVRFALPTR